VVDGFVWGEDECTVCGFEGVGGTAYDMAQWCHTVSGGMRAKRCVCGGL